MGSRQEAPTQSHITRQVLEDPDLQSALQIFCQLLTTAQGPHGRIQSIHNSVGGPIMMTTSSSRMFSTMSFSRPCLRLIVSAAEGHLKNHHDGGLLMGSLCIHLVRNAVKLESVTRQCVRDVYNDFLVLIDEYLNSEDCPVSVTVDLSDVKVMLAYIRSILGSKPVCGLRPASMNYLSQLVLRAFLNSVPDTPMSFLSDRVLTLGFDKSDFMSSEVMEGLLLEWPEKCTLLGEQDLKVSKGSLGEVKVAVVNVSLSGDTDESLTNQTEAQYEVVQSATDLIVKKMLAFCDWLIDKQVGVLLCQKVIHPKVKSYLRQKGIVFVERIGAQPMGYIHDLTGADFIGSVLVTPQDNVCGRLTSVTHRILHNKSYLHLQRVDSCICTLLLCASVNEQLAELKCTVQSAMTGLYSVLQRPYVLCGGGCWQIHLANLVRHTATTNFKEMSAKFHMTKAQLQEVANAFATSLEASAQNLCDPSFQSWVDVQNQHSWHAPQGVDLTMSELPFTCACGMFTSADVEKDSFHLHQGSQSSCYAQFSSELGRVSSCKRGRLVVRDLVNYDWLVFDTVDCVVSAVRTAVMTATTVLSISQYIHDTN